MPAGYVTPPVPTPTTPSVRPVTSNATTSENDDVIMVDCTAASLTLTLHPASTASGKPVVIKRVDANTSTVLTIAPSSGDTIMEGTPNIIVNTGMVNFTFRTDRTNKWFASANYWPYQNTTPAADTTGGAIGGAPGQQVIVLGDHQHPTSPAPLSLRGGLASLTGGLADALTATRAGTYSTLVAGKLATAGTTATTVQVRKNGTAIATITYPIGSITGTVSGFSPVTLAVGDVVDLNVTGAGLGALGLKVGLDK